MPALPREHGNLHAYKKWTAVFPLRYLHGEHDRGIEMEKRCKHCRHVQEGKPNKCGLTANISSVLKSCFDERRQNGGYACGPEGKYWEPVSLESATSAE